jgi:hypothetical protein
MELVSPTVDKLRIPIVIAIVIGEIAGLTYFYEHFLLSPSNGRRALSGFLMLSLMGTALIVAYLWSDWLLRRHIKYFEVALVVILGPSAVQRFSRGKPFQGILDGVICLIGLIAILPRLFRPAGTDVRETDPRTAETLNEKRISVPSRRLSARYFGMLLIWLIAVDLSTSHVTTPIPFWIETAFALPAIWFAWEVVFYLFKRPGD